MVHIILFPSRAPSLPLPHPKDRLANQRIAANYLSIYVLYFRSKLGPEQTLTMCQQCGSDFLEYESNKPGFPEDLPFTPNDFVNACLLARDGPFEADNDNWTRLVRMYNRIITLHIDVVQYCEDIFPEKLIGSSLYLRFLAADQAHRGRAPLPLGLPFSAEEFLPSVESLQKLRKQHTTALWIYTKDPNRYF
jgi:hypothetical protein